MNPNWCSACQKAIPADAPAGQCPTCLMEIALTEDEQASPIFNGTKGDTLPRFGGYLLGRQLGAGGMGVVYEAQHVSSQRKVAIKLIRDDHLASPMQFNRFSLETDAVARLDHPNIVRLYEAGEVEGHPFFSMELIHGESLGAKFARAESPLQWKSSESGEARQARLKQMVQLMVKTALAVHHAHERGVLHRDLKPANILIDERGEPHLTDFGLAKLVRQEGGKQLVGLTTAGSFLGTPSYMSPEQVSGKEATRASDLYALGAILYELLAGQPPFGGATPFEILRQILETHAPSLQALNPAVPKDLQTICLNCLEKDPARRYRSAAALAEDLTNWLEARPIKARPPSLQRRLGEWVRHNRVGTILIATLCLGLAIALFLLKVVKDQRDEINGDRNQAFEEGLNRIRLLWDDPNQKEVTVSARELAIMGGRSAAKLPRDSLSICFAVATDADPTSLAQGFAELLVQLQERLNRELARPITFNIKIFKRLDTNPGALVKGQADLMLFSAVEYLKATQVTPGISAIARDQVVHQGVLFTHAGNGVNKLSQLQGRSVAFPDPSLSISVWARSRLEQAGFRESDFRRCTNILDRQSGPKPLIISSYETMHQVLSRQAEAGITYRSLYERYQHQGLIMLDQFPETPDVLAARPGLDPEIVRVIRKNVHRVAGRSGFDHFSVNLPASMVSATDADFAPLREALLHAERFENKSSATEIR